MKTIKLLCFLNLIVTFSSCGRKVDIIDTDRIYILGPYEMTCEYISYPIERQDCYSKNTSCTTWSNGKTECLVHFTGRDIEEKL